MADESGREPPGASIEPLTREAERLARAMAAIDLKLRELGTLLTSGALRDAAEEAFLASPVYRAGRWVLLTALVLCLAVWGAGAIYVALHVRSVQAQAVEARQEMQEALEDHSRRVAERARAAVERIDAVERELADRVAQARLRLSLDEGGPDLRAVGAEIERLRNDLAAVRAEGGGGLGVWRVAGTATRVLVLGLVVALVAAVAVLSLHHRRWVAVTMAVVFVLGTLLVVSVLVLPLTPLADPRATVAARELIVSDASGNPRLRVGSLGDGTAADEGFGIVIFKAGGTERSSVVLLDREGQLVWKTETAEHDLGRPDAVPPAAAPGSAPGQ
jgi:hypothetical protein